MDPLLFWDYTPAEIQAMVTADARQREAKLKQDISLMDATANLIIEGVAYVLSATKQPPPSLPKRFPTLYEAETQAALDAQLALQRARMIEYGEQHNAEWAKRKRGEVDGRD